MHRAQALPQEFRNDVVAVARRGQAPLEQIAADFGIAWFCLCTRARKVARLLAHHGLIGSMGQVESADDNAATERTFALL